MASTGASFTIAASCCTVFELGCYDTRDAISALLVRQLQVKQPRRILDLGSGEGNLLHAARSRWPGSMVHAAEIDPCRKKLAALRFPDVRVIQADGLDRRLNLYLEIDEGSIDVAICNPPYRRFSYDVQHQVLLDAAGLGCQLKVLTSDLLFLAQNLRLLRPGGELGIIVPDGLITGKEFVPLRATLLENHEVFGVIQLPDHAFMKTEARTHILLLRQGGRSPGEISLHQADTNGEIVSSLTVPVADAVSRMDHGFWCWRGSQSFMDRAVTLGKLGVEIRRGVLPRAEYERQAVPFFHTTDFPASPDGKIRLCSTKASLPHVTAQRADILLARVGTRCIGRVGLVASGQAVVTDCVYRIRVPEPWIEAAFLALRSSAGQRWLAAYAHGVCAKVISKSDLLDFPLICGMLRA